MARMKRLLLVLLLILLAFIAGAFALPTQVHVERSIAVARPPATVFTLLNSYRHFNRWSPWAQADPDAVYRFSGPESGVGAKLSWSGDPALVGEGWQEIVLSEPYERIGMRLDFGTQGIADSAFLIRGDSLGSEVTWQFETDVTEGQGLVGGILGRYFGLFLDDWVGADFEKGLVAFSHYAESLPPIDVSAGDISRVEAQPVRVLMVAGESGTGTEEIGRALADAYGAITAWMSAQGLRQAGQPLAIAVDAGDSARYRFEAAIPVDELALQAVDPALLDAAGPVRPGWTPGGAAVRVVHTGAYDRLGESYERLAAWMAVHGLERGDRSWEVYVSDPASTPESQWITHIFVQLSDT